MKLKSKTVRVILATSLLWLGVDLVFLVSYLGGLEDWAGPWAPHTADLGDTAAEEDTGTTVFGAGHDAEPPVYSENKVRAEVKSWNTHRLLCYIRFFNALKWTKSCVLQHYCNITVRSCTATSRGRRCRLWRGCRGRWG